MENVLQILDKLQPLKSKKDPAIAGIIGFLFGGIGLGIYFLSFIDFVLLIVVGFILLGTLNNFGWFLGACFAGAYGYFRAVNSNERISKKKKNGTQS